MASIQERLQMKREPLDKWSIREQLCLASAVNRSGDQNWMSVSRALKPFGDPNRPTDWFHQKNCAAQFGALLANVETPKRKKRTSGAAEIGIETPVEIILKKLLQERQAEIKVLMAEERAEFLKLQDDMLLLQKGKVSEEQLEKWCKEIDEEEQRKEEENLAHAQWLKERETRKQEIERAWRPSKLQTTAGQKRKYSDSIENLLELEQNEDQQLPQEPAKPALSPLLTSLLKSPSQVQNVAANSSILHSAITSNNQRPVSTNTNPMIASLLNSSANVSVSPGLQLLVSSAIGQEPENDSEEQTQSLGSDILDDATLPNLKIDDLANSILDRDGPLPEIKNEEVDVIISDLIDNAQDIVADPEQHLQLDGNGDININLELDDFEDDPEEVIKEELSREIPKPIEKPLPTIDPFEFQEDPEVVQPGKLFQYQQQPPPYQAPHYQQNNEPAKKYTQYQSVQFQPPPLNQSASTSVQDTSQKDSEYKIKDEKEIKKELVEEQPKKDHKEVVPGSVEIVEVVVMEDEEVGKQLNRSQIEDIVHSTKTDSLKQQIETNNTPIKTNEIESIINDNKIISKPNESVAQPEKEKDKEEIEVEINTEPKDDSDTNKTNSTIVNADSVKNEDASTSTPDFAEELYEDILMEIKVDKSSKVKRDYSRTKKKEEKDFDMLLAIEKAHMEENELTDVSFSDKEYQESEITKKDVKSKLKAENDRSNSPWTEEEDVSTSKLRRRYSTPATPVDSIPNSPASSITAYEDDRDYRNWKKSVMLVYSRLATHKYASLFLKPITDDQAPGYHTIVYRPQDLQTIRKNIDSGTIRTTQEFQRDVLLMFTNAIMYNKTNATIYDMARQMMHDSLEPLKILLQAQSQADVSLRRETRTSESGSKRKRPIEENTRNKKRKDE